MSPEGVERRPVDAVATSRANRGWWDGAADDYQAEHGPFLRDAGFVWCPEGLDEADARLLGDVAGRDVLEIGCGAGQCGRWLAGQGARVAAFDLSFRQLQHSRRIDLDHAAGDGSGGALGDDPGDGPGGAGSGPAGRALPVVQADAEALPFADESFDLACSAYGALPFVADATAVLAETRRVLRPGGRFVFSVSHPVRWAFPDDPGPRGLTADRSYFDRSPYVEVGPDGEPSYVEHHRTMADWVDCVTAAGLVLAALTEPEWPPGHDRVWGGWSPLRGRHLPGTAIFTCVRPR
ncbi:class I SAM-dependent methyltransferase [Planomonospora parontospora]|uniref:class I SAM-dependent methyltransferase n=1 Tax=Planomonospora parontospora TaxID=58119 RepID=UPI0016717C3C|nr:class I SAM-dependent methyltransferase [Planomonospora parontospora]GGL04044.1 SAM-dependent methyltransferase [Planomonospora parontospora subsp. antibiotica]GII13432.1 SAM-dependent methyltransferase [Planomonospora parontospora subsp. antibiotica]